MLNLKKIPPGQTFCVFLKSRGRKRRRGSRSSGKRMIISAG